MRQYDKLEKHLLGLMMVLFVASAIWVYIDPKPYLETVNYITFTMDFMGQIILIILGSNIVIEKKNDKEGLLFELLLFMDFIALVSDVACWMVNYRVEYIFLNNLFNIIYYCCGPLCAMVFWRYLIIMENIQGKLLYYVNCFVQIVTTANILFAVTNPLTHFVFYVDKSGEYFRKSGFIVSTVCVLIIMLIGMIYILRLKAGIGKKLALLTYPVMPLVGIIIQTFMFGFAVIYIGLLISIIIMYTAIYLKRGILLEKQRLELQEQGTRIAVSQIQPHFIYNSLTAISVLCTKDPELASTAIEKFTQYLRTNLHSVDQSDLVSFKKEMEHTMTYVWLEQLRFKDKISVEYRINEENFDIPALCIQPLVENAIKHGICKRKGPGTVIVESNRNGDTVEVIVSDDGLGFDMEAAALQNESESMKHVGIRNVRKRVEMLCGGRLEITSSPGKGTICKIVIPVK